MKKGVSALISTVLVVGFVIIIFLIFSSWSQESIVKESLEKTEGRIAKQFDCSAIDIEVVDACVNSIDNAEKLQMNVDVTGDDPIKYITIKLIGEDGDVEIREYGASSPVSLPGRLLTAKSELSLENSIENLIEIEVYPKTENGDVCRDKVEVIKNIKEC